MIGIDAIWEQARCSDFREHIKAFARLVAEAEREECAKVCVDYAHNLSMINHNDHPMPIEVARDCAEEIRARSSN